jgi:predicted AAA+ superfamily ATPase
MAELEIGVMSRQCLNRRIGTIEAMSDEVQAWAAKRNSRNTTIQWQFTTKDARIKLQHLYPKI